mgnify:CR=1 FL=1
MMENASDWYLYEMDKDKSYDNVIFAVVGNADTDIRNSRGDFISVMPMEVPQNVARRYLMLASDQGQALCHQNVKENCTRLTTHAWLSAIQTERMEWQTEEIRRRAKEYGSWETAYFVTIARTFGMGIKDTQFLLVRHFDRSNSVRLLPTGRKNGNPHCHLVYNRINDEGKTITDQNDFRRNEQVTKLLKRKYGLTFSKGKGRTKTERLRGTEKTMVSTNRPKYEIYHAVGTGLLRCKSWPEFVNHLRANGVEVELVVKRNGSKDLNNIQGMRFTKDGITFKASQIRRGLSFAGIMSKLNSNAEKDQQRTINSHTRLIHAEQPREETYSEPQKHNEPSIGIPPLGLFDTTNPVYDPAEEEFRRRMQKKKKKRGPRL